MCGEPRVRREAPVRVPIIAPRKPLDSVRRSSPPGGAGRADGPPPSSSTSYEKSSLTSLDELRSRIRRFAEDFNEHWLLERHDYHTPRQVRDTFWWGSAFLIAVPPMVLLLVAGPRLLPEYRNPDAGRLDVISAAQSLLAALASVYGVKEASAMGSAPRRVWRWPSPPSPSSPGNSGSRIPDRPALARLQHRARDERARRAGLLRVLSVAVQ